MAKIEQKIKETVDKAKSKAKVGGEKTQEKAKDTTEKAKQKLK